jgi:hypothetical protein
MSEIRTIRPDTLVPISSPGLLFTGRYHFPVSPPGLLRCRGYFGAGPRGRGYFGAGGYFGADFYRLIDRGRVQRRFSNLGPGPEGRPRCPGTVKLLAVVTAVRRPPVTVLEASTASPDVHAGRFDATDVWRRHDVWRQTRHRRFGVNRCERLLQRRAPPRASHTALTASDRFCQISLEPHVARDAHPRPYAAVRLHEVLQPAGKHDELAVLRGDRELRRK